jgi:hypothetical protein
LVVNAVALTLVALPDFDRLKQLIKRLIELLMLGGVTLAVVASLIFLLAWVLSFLRQPTATSARPILPTLALWCSSVPIALTAVAAVGMFVPTLTPFVLKCFALAVITAAVCWCLATAAIIIGGSREHLARARRALILAGTPWYCLVLYLIPRVG